MTREEKIKAARFAQTPEKRREIARLGMKALREKGLHHQYNHDTGKAAGRKGGYASQESARRRKAEQINPASE